MEGQYDFLQAGMGRRTFLKGAALTGLAVGAAELWVQSPRASTGMPVSRHVAFGADPQRQAVVSFATPGSFRTAVVDYGVNGVLDRSAAVDVRSVRGVSTRYGHAVLRDLSPGQNYHYRLRLDDLRGPAGTLSTAPSRPEPFAFTAFGDEGVSPRVASKSWIGL
jgi:phosphodiesterase/alkaline phosphatase D-like protein